MVSTCIIADSAAQFSKINFPDSITLRFIEHKTTYCMQSGKLKDITNDHLFPSQLSFDQGPIVDSPSNDDLFAILNSCINSFDEVFIILHSRELNPVFDIVSNFISKNPGRASVHLIDSQTLSIGQGYLVQRAASMIEKKVDGSIVEQRLREEIPHIYTLLCTPNLSYLHTAGFIDVGQCVVGEMGSLLPIFGLEDGKLNPLDKEKSIHGVIEYFTEFIEEFDNLSQISFLQPNPALYSESKSIKQYLEENYPDTFYSEHPLNCYLASLIGPRGFGLVVIERSS